MRPELKELHEIIKELSNKTDWEKNISTLKCVANLLFENYEEHLKGAVLNREVFHGRLRITLDYRPVQPTPEEVAKCQQRRSFR